MPATIRGNIALAGYLFSIDADKRVKTPDDGDPKTPGDNKPSYDYAMDNGHYELAEPLKP